MALWMEIDKGEQLLWQGRPAPRCFVFRHWRRMVFGLVLALLAAGWEYSGWQLTREQGQYLWLVLPLPVLLIGLWLALGLPVRARLEWERVGYLLTDRQLVVRCGWPRQRLLRVPLEQITYVCLYPLGEQLGNVYVEAGRRRLVLSCVEYPQQVYQQLQAVVEQR